MVWAAIRLNTLSSLGMLLVLTLLWVVMSIGEITYLLLLPLALSATFERLSDARLGVAIADGDARNNFVGLVGRRILSVVIFLLASGLGANPVLAFTGAAAFGGLASFIYAARVVRIQVPERTRRPGVRSVFRASLHYWINSFALQLRNLDTTLATLFGGAVQGGFFGLASRLTVPLRLPASSMGAALLPVAARQSEATADTLTQRRKLLRTAALGWSVCSVIYLIAVPLIPPLLPVLVGQAYTGAILPLQISLGGLCFAAFCSLGVPVLQGWGFQRWVAIVSVFSTAVCLAGVAAGAVLLGSIGAAIALAGSFALQALLIAVPLIGASIRTKENS